MFKSFHSMFRLLTPRERRNFFILIGMIFFMGCAEVIGVASILPFIAVLTNENLIHDVSILDFLYTRLGFQSSVDFTIFLGVIFLCIFLISTLIKALTNFAIIRFTVRRSASLSVRLLQGYLRQDYAWFLSRHSADLSKTLLSEVDRAVQDALIPAAKLLAQVVVVILLVGLLIVVEPIVSPIVMIFFGLIYMVILWATRKYLSRIAVERLNANSERFRVSQESLSGIKELKIMGLEETYFGRFRAPAEKYADTQAWGQLVREMPRYFVEASAFGGFILIIMYFFIREGKDFNEMAPLLSLFALAGVRLFPALQQIYRDISSLRFGAPSVDLLLKDLNSLEPDKSLAQGASRAEPPVRPKAVISFKDCSFRYPNSERFVIKNLSLDLQANTVIGICGGTGAGKTTLIDMLLGLLLPATGGIYVDGERLSEHNLRSWQAGLGYVPQDIYLIDASVAENIAFGQSSKDIDGDAVRRAAEAAGIHSFICSDLERGYDTGLGDRGVRLSGGQKQRIGIARALYRNPGVLVFDEATSALDTITERAIIESVRELAGEKTIFMIAHRIATLKICDEILVLENGEISSRGSYDALLSSDPKFQLLANAS